MCRKARATGADNTGVTYCGTMSVAVRLKLHILPVDVVRFDGDRVHNA